MGARHDRTVQAGNVNGYKIEVDDHEVRRALEYMKGNSGKLTRLIVSRLAAESVAKVQHVISGTGHFRTHPTGQLMQEMGFRRVSNTTAEVFEDAIYGAIHEYGGDIYPVNGEFLAFQIDGEWIFTRHVYIPPRPYFHPTIQKYLESDEAKKLCYDTIQEMIDKAIGSAI